MNNIELRKDLKNIKKENLNSLLLVSYYSIFQYLRELIKYGSSSKIANSNKELLKEFFMILKEENMYLNILIKNINVLKENEVYALIDKLDVLHDKMIEFIYNTLDDLEDAYELGREYRATIPNKNFKTILETDEYRKEIVRLILGESVIKEYFNYPEEFWNYIKNRITLLHEDVESRDEFYGVYPKITEENILIDLKIYIPKILDLKTLLINIHELNHAYILYTKLNQKFEDIDYEILAKQEEKDFLNNYFEPVYTRTFK